MGSRVLVIRRALDIGVSLFNSGKADACAAVYASALQQLSADRTVPRDTAAWIGQELAEARSVQNDSDRAWRLRDTIDALIRLETSQSASASASTALPCSLDFAAGGGDAVRSFLPLNDEVMGGRSTSSLRMSSGGGHAVFSGRINTNGGGFAGCRARVAGAPPSTRGLSVCARGDGQLYKLVVEQDGGQGGVSYQSDFVAERDWSTVQLPLRSFRASWRGRPVPQAPPLQPSAITRLGLRLSLLTDEGQPNRTLKEGVFRLDVRHIKPYA